MLYSVSSDQVQVIYRRVFSHNMTLSVIEEFATYHTPVTPSNQNKHYCSDDQFTAVS